MNKYMRFIPVLAASVVFSGYSPVQKVEEPTSCAHVNESFSAFNSEIENIIEHKLKPIIIEHAEKNLSMDVLVAKVKEQHLQADKFYNAYVAGLAPCIDDTVKLRGKNKPQNGFYH
jgi:hypothetical protein